MIHTEQYSYLRQAVDAYQVSQRIRIPEALEEMYVVRACQNSFIIKLNSETERSPSPRTSIQMTVHSWTAILHTTQTHIVVTDHQREPNNDKFVLIEMKVENRQNTNLCKSNLSALPAECSRMLIINN